MYMHCHYLLLVFFLIVKPSFNTIRTAHWDYANRDHKRGFPVPIGLLASFALLSASDLPFKNIKTAKVVTSFKSIFTAILCCLKVLEMSEEVSMDNDSGSEWEQDATSFND